MNICFLSLRIWGSGYMIPALSMVVSGCGEGVPDVCIYDCRISKLDNLDRPLGLIGIIFYTSVCASCPTAIGPYF
jgi:hypothetical protein